MDPELGDNNSPEWGKKASANFTGQELWRFYYEWLWFRQ
jgi:hypothetical protein